MKYIKKNLPVKVNFAIAAGMLQTMEGTVAYDAGDALMTGAEGESWPITRENFDATYKPVLPTKTGQNGFYLKSPVDVEAIQVQTDFTQQIKGGMTTLYGKQNDWIITAPNGSQWIIDDEIFRKTYQKSENES